MSAASITIRDLRWAAPGAEPLFTNLDLAVGAERVGLVGRNGVGKTTLLRLVAGELKPQAGAVLVQGRLGMLRQAVRVGGEEQICDLFGVREPLAILERAAGGQAGEEDLAAADWLLEGRMAASLARMGLEAAPTTPLAALSGGQRTRAALAALIFAEPDVLILDEPTNNLDRDGRDAVIELVRGWPSAALVVSHDRELLEEMDAIVELTTLGAARHSGGWSDYAQRKALELEALEHRAAEADRRRADIARDAQAQAERQARRDAAGRRKGAKGDMPKILLGARMARAQATGGDQARRAERRMQDAEASAAAARARLEVIAPLRVTAPSTGLAAGTEVLRLEEVSAGHAPDRPLLSGLSLRITGPERVAITGPNGAGKSTLLALIAGELDPMAGRVRRPASLALLDQTVSLLEPGASILENFRRLHPGAAENACRAALARFRFRAEAALQAVAALSGGQLLRAGLACVLGGPRPPTLLMLDEPTNHLDIDSVEAVEAGLGAFDGALIVVSHDADFLRNLGVERTLELAPPR